MFGTSGLGEFELETWGLDFNEFTQEFPQGPYFIVPFPHTDSFKFVNIAYNFPPTPNVTFPIDGQTNVSLTHTITWVPMPGIDYIWLGIFEENGDGRIDVDLGPGVTSFTIPGGCGALKPNTRYFVLLGGAKDIGYEIESTRLLYFTTGN